LIRKDGGNEWEVKSRQDALLGNAIGALITNDSVDDLNEGLTHFVDTFDLFFPEHTAQLTRLFREAFCGPDQAQNS
jgi:hypothetical protein